MSCVLYHEVHFLDNILIITWNVVVTVWETAHWIYLAEYRNQWQNFVNTAMDFRGSDVRNSSPGRVKSFFFHLQNINAVPKVHLPSYSMGTESLSQQ
jgi:hypothetical protein